MLAVLLFLYGLGTLAISQSSESGLSEIGDLGNLLLGGFVLAIGVAIALSPLSGYGGVRRNPLKRSSYRSAAWRRRGESLVA